MSEGTKASLQANEKKTLHGVLIPHKKMRGKKFLPSFHADE